MGKSKKSMDQNWQDIDDAPDLSTQDWQNQFAKVAVKRGRPPSSNPKMQTTIRLDKDVIAALKAGGNGWQTRANQLLRHALKI